MTIRPFSLAAALALCFGAAGLAQAADPARLNMARLNTGC